MNKSFNLFEINSIAKEILNSLDSRIILIYGEMGVGKTTLIRELVKELGYTRDISSPTFSIVNEYELRENLVYHFDFYRIESEEEIYDIGFEDYLQTGNWIFIEWPEKVKYLIHEQVNEICLLKEDNNKRTINLKTEIKI